MQKGSVAFDRTHDAQLIHVQLIHFVLVVSGHHTAGRISELFGPGPGVFVCGDAHIRKPDAAQT